jgi:glycine C-acetyltransferase/8-amino-7-oxononanoate synthase
VAEAGVEDQVDVVVGTLGKALGSYGAFVACDDRMRGFLVNSLRTFIFSTAPPPPAAAAALAALEVLESTPRLVERLGENGSALRSELEREGFDIRESRTQIVPLVVGDASLAVRICERALTRGVFAQAIRPPSVPPGSSRLRLATMASHKPDELRNAARVLAEAARSEGFDPQRRLEAVLADAAASQGSGALEFDPPAPVARAA